MNRYIKYSGVVIVLLSVAAMSATSCKKKKDKVEAADTLTGNYFSINQFLIDEWNTFQGQPFMISKTVKEGEKVDSSLTNSDTISWAPLVKVFAVTDISDRKYLGQYKFSQFDDNADQTHNFFYEAIDEDLFTRKLLITIDRFTSKVKGIYLETEKKTLFDDRVQKLYYKPLQTVQIQTDDKPLLGSKKYTVEQYEFIR
ncbi:MAG: hypothetical protein JWQ38_2185 [Flavipsychrobacter sp.]|nr:hypothetical protein [Flavipsychrobacter sp.]